ncbi:MAG: 23S rRNA (guanosine(2251)-2'-O)-methyltransferase RlmB [Hyphomicrobiaceae bacterium]|nr:23S rRNA (guanosine(2251)-2'-O)-methyltransferase RlmB [Hyphomicrobiaceae bacterium]
MPALCSRGAFLSIGKASWSASDFSRAWAFRPISPDARQPQGLNVSKDRPRPPQRPWTRKSGAPSRSGHQGAGGTRHARPHASRRDSDRSEDGPLRLFGLHAVEAALKNPSRKILRLVLTENAERRLVEAVGVLNRPIERATPRDLDRILGADTVHQGAMLETEPLPEPEFADLVAQASGRPLIVLDQVTDPHNVGAILRSAAAFGAAGLVMTRRHSPPLNGVLAKSASGALELIPVALVQNLSRALEELKEVGFCVVGLDGEAQDAIEELDWSRPTALVMGAEGKGLRELTGKTCDQLARITTDGPLASLNVSNAAAVALHAALVARAKAKS